MDHPVVIIGTGLAGYHIAKEFRKLDTQTPMTIITQDDGRFYSKPLLSSAFTHDKTAAQLAICDHHAMAKQLQATLYTHTTVREIHPAASYVMTDNDKIYYSQLVLACGAQVVKPKFSGDAVDSIFTVNNLTDYAIFRAALSAKKTVAIIGAGLIGSEFCYDLINGGFSVHCIANCASPLDLLLPPTIGGLLQAALSRHGVQWHLGVSVQYIHKNKTQYDIVLHNGTVITADLVLSAIGITPQLALAQSAGLGVNRGIIVDHFLATTAPRIYALGDCAEVAGVVSPYVAPLLLCARALAKTLCGQRTAVTYPAMPIVVKTPVYPLAIVLPPSGKSVTWTHEYSDSGVRALCYDENERLRGFILTENMVQERHELAKKIPHYF